MPILADDDQVPVSGLVPQLAEPLATSAPAAPFSTLFGTEMLRNNVVGSAAEALTQPARAPFDPSFDPFGQDGERIRGYEDHARAFLGDNSEDDVLATKARIDAERRRADIQANGGVMGLLASGAATLLDPTTVIPVGGQFMAVTRTGRALAGAARIGAASAVGTAAQEAGLQATQVTRPWSESAVNVAASTVIGGALGGAIGALSRPVAQGVARGLEEFSSRVMRESEDYGRELGAIERGYVDEDASVTQPSAAPSGGVLRSYLNRGDFPEPQERVAAPITAYHGSRHDVTKFRKALIGTGEGNQTYGYGMYFAESPDVASTYRDGGSLYEVNLHVADIMDLELPLGQQSPAVQAAVAKAVDSIPKWGFRDSFGRAWSRERALDPNSTGEDVYWALRRGLNRGGRGGFQEASEALARAGLHGLRFFDEESRAAKSGTRNYVIFDEARIEVLKKNGEDVQRNPSPVPAQSMTPDITLGPESLQALDDIARRQALETGISARGGSAGAAAARDTTLEQETLQSALGMGRALAQTAPNLRPMFSPSLESRHLIQELAELPVGLRKNEEGIPSPRAVETDLRQASAPLAEALGGLDDLFVRYRTGGDRGIGSVTRLAVGDLVRDRAGKLSYDEFAEQVGRAMRREDQHEVPEVAQAAKLMRDRVFDPWKERAIKAGLLDEDVSTDTALSYFMRVYNNERIIAKRPEITQRFAGWLADEQAKKDTIRGKVSDLITEQKELSGRVRKREAKIELRSRKLREQEIRREEVSRLNAFAFKRSAAMTQPIDQIRASIRNIEARFTPQQRAVAEDALAGLRDGETLVDVIAGGDDFVKAVQRLAREGSGLSPEERAGLVQARTEIGKLIRPYRRELRRLRGDLKEEMRRKGGAARGGAVFESRIRGRINTLSDQASGTEGIIDEIGGRLDKDQARLEAIRAEIEDLVSSWEGNTSMKAKSALKRRAEKEATREPGKGRLKEADKPVSKAARAIARANTRQEEEDLNDIAKQIIDRILSTPIGRLPYDVETPSPRGRPSDGPPPRGPLAHRAFKIPDEMIEDILESDVRVIARLYNRTMASDVTLTEKFGRVDMEDQIKKILSDYEILRQGKSEAELKKLDAQMRADIRDIAAVRDRLRGTYGLPDNPNGLANRAYHVIRDLNYLRLLGGMTISAFSDVGRAVMVHGISRVARDGLAPMLSNFKKFRLAGKETQLAGTALDMVLDTRAMAMADMLDDYGRWSKYERGLQGMSRKFGLATLMAPWNSAMKQFAGVVSQTRTLQAVEKLAAGSGVSKAETTRLARLGIGQDEAERITAQFKAHGEKTDGGVWWANTAAWDDQAAVDAFRGALAKEVDEIIVTPGMERPLIMSGAWGNTGRLLGQFKGFAMSSTQRVLLSGLQRRDMATLNGVLLMTALGMMTYYVKHQLNDNPNKKDLPDPTTADGMAQWLREGVDRSGLTGWLFDAHNTMEKATGGAVGLQRFIGEAPTSRYSSRGVLGAVTGPTGGLIEDAGRAVRGAATGDPTEGDINAARRILPLQNTIGFRHLFDAAEEGVQRSVGTR